MCSEGDTSSEEPPIQNERLKALVAELGESHRRLSEGLPLPLLQADAEQRILFASAPFLRRLGLPGTEVRGRHLREAFGEQVYGCMRPCLQRVLCGEEVNLDPETAVGMGSGAGTVLPTRYLPEIAPDGSIRGFFALLDDRSVPSRDRGATLRLRPDLSLHLDEMVALLDAAPIGILLARDPQCRHIISNRAGREMLRLAEGLNPSPSGPDAPSLGFRIYRDGRPLEAEELPMQYAAAHATTVRDQDIDVVFDDGSRITLATYAAPLYDEKRRVIGCLGTFIDVTERRRAKQALAEADRRKNEFLAMLGHELRNPLVPILNAVQVLARRETAADETAAEVLDWAVGTLQRQTRHLVRLVDDLLDLACITQGIIRIERKPLVLQEVLAEALDTLHPEIDARRHEIRTELPASPVTVAGDFTRLTQVFCNLLGNAIKYTAEGGRLRLALASRDGAAEVTVQDNGVGIATDRLDSIFAPFCRDPDRESDRGAEGLGLGLTLVERLVALHQGDVQAYSEGPDTGSHFVVRLPLTPSGPTVERADQRAAPRVTATSPRRVVVVDDNKDVADSLGVLISSLGHRVRCAYSGAQALEAVRRFHPDLVLLDIGLPDMDGYALAERLRALDQGRRIRLVVVSGRAHPPQQAPAEHPFERWLLKPVALETLQEILGAGDRATS